MTQWQILVLGVLRLGLNADYDRIGELANQHRTVRQMLGVFGPRVQRLVDEAGGARTVVRTVGAVSGGEGDIDADAALRRMGGNQDRYRRDLDTPFERLRRHRRADARPARRRRHC